MGEQAAILTGTTDLAAPPDPASDRTSHALATALPDAVRPAPTWRDRLGLTRAEIGRAGLDLGHAVHQHWFWLSLGWNDIVQRYRGSMLGPFWLTLTTGIFIAGLGPLYAALFKLDPAKYLPFMAVGIIVWNFITTAMNEFCRTFMDGSGIMRQMKLPRLTMILHTLWRNVIIFAHSLPIYFLVMWACGTPVTVWTLGVVPGFLLLCLNLVWIGLLLAMICLRYRDVLQIVASILQLGFFFTPVMWNPKLQSVSHWVVNLNPFAALLELVRAPLLGEPMSAPLLGMALGLLFVGSLLTSVLFVRYRRHIIYWV